MTRGVVFACIFIAAVAGCGDGDTKTVVERTTTVTERTPPPTETSTTPDSATPTPGYKDAVEEAATEFRRVSQDAGAKLRAAQTKEQFAVGADQFQGAVTTFNRKLDALTPPAAAEEPQRRLIEVLNDFSEDVGAVRDALNAGDMARIQQLQGEVVTDVAKVQRAAKALEDAADVG